MQTTDRSRALRYNTIASLLQQIIILLSGFVLTRMYLQYFGSQNNGLLSSLNQFMGRYAMADLWISAVVQSALYAPLAGGDEAGLHRTCLAGRRFYAQLGLLYAGYTALLLVFYPQAVQGEFSPGYIRLLAFAVSLSTFAEYYAGLTDRVLITAAQRGYVIVLVQLCTSALNLVLLYLLLRAGCSLPFVKLVSAAVFFLRPLLYRLYARRCYPAAPGPFSGEKTEARIPERWDSFSQFLLTVVMNSGDVIILTLCSTLANVSVYAVYSLVIIAMRSVVSSAFSGVQSFLGDLYARNERPLLHRVLDAVEWISHAAGMYLWACTACLIMPFVLLYTAGLNDAPYRAPLFGLLLTAGQMLYCARLPYYAVIQAAGHYRAIRRSAVIETAINVAGSLLLVAPCGLAGVAAATLAAMLYRTVYYAVYLRGSILERPLRRCLTAALPNLLAYAVCCALWYERVTAPSAAGWVCAAILVCLANLAVFTVCNLLFARSRCRQALAECGALLKRRGADAQ